MSRKSKNRDTQPKAPEAWEHLGNPFADLKIDFPPPPPKPVPPPPTKEEQMESELSRADKALLEEFRTSGEVQSIGWTGGTASPAKPSGKTLKFSIQRKGHNGKTVTNVHGLKEFSLEERMRICGNVKKELGIGARFVDDILELQGDQRDRAFKWFDAHGFRCQIV